VGSIAKRVQDDIEIAQPSRFDNLRAIGIDETSYKKGHKYMTVIIDHATGHLIWAGKGYGKAVLSEFFNELSAEQRQAIRFVTADGARWIADCVAEYCKNAERCLDPFHVVGWATEALDNVRKRIVKEAQIKAASGETMRDAKKNGKTKRL
jgi:transposase